MLNRLFDTLNELLNPPKTGKLTERQVMDIEAEMGENFPKVMRNALLKPSYGESYKAQRKALAQANGGERPLQLTMLTQDGILDKDKPVASEQTIRGLTNNEHAIQKDNAGFYRGIKNKSTQ